MHDLATISPLGMPVQPGHDSIPLGKGRQTGKLGPLKAAFTLSLKPSHTHIIYHNEVTVMMDADPSMFTCRVGTLSLVLLVGTFLAHVATEVTLKAWPVWH